MICKPCSTTVIFLAVLAPILSFLVSGVTLGQNSRHPHGKSPQRIAGHTKKQSNLVTDGHGSLLFDPPLLDFGDCALSVVWRQKVNVRNDGVGERAIDILSISGSSLHFHCSFVADKVLDPAANTSFEVVFLSREEGYVEETLYIHTNQGSFPYRIVARGTPNPFMAKPLVNVQIPLNTTFSPLIHLYNPFSSALQVLEMFGSSCDVHLEMPVSSEDERELFDWWIIPPYHSKAIAKVHFLAMRATNVTSFVRIRTNYTAHPHGSLMLPVSLEVTSQPLLFCPQQHLDFGVVQANDPPKTLKLFVINSGSKPITVQSVTASPLNEGLSIDFSPVKVPPSLTTPTLVALVTFRPSSVNNLRTVSGRIVVKSKTGQLKASVGYHVTVPGSYLHYNVSSTKFLASDHQQLPSCRQLSVVNDFALPVDIIDASIAPQEYVEIRNFRRRTLRNRQQESIVDLCLKKMPPLAAPFTTSLLLRTNASSALDVSVSVFTGKVVPIWNQPEASLVDTSANQTDHFIGRLARGSSKELYLALWNPNPIGVGLQGWGTNSSSVIVTYLGSDAGDASHFQNRRLDFSNLTMATTVRPNNYAVFHVHIHPMVLDPSMDASDADGASDSMPLLIYVKTLFETVAMTLHYRWVRGSIRTIPAPQPWSAHFLDPVLTTEVRLNSTLPTPVTVLGFRATPHLSYDLFGDVIQAFQSAGIARLTHPLDWSCATPTLATLMSQWQLGERWWNALNDLEATSTLRQCYETLRDSIQLDSVKLVTKEIGVVDVAFRPEVTWPQLAVQRRIQFPLTEMGHSNSMELKLVNPTGSVVLAQILWLEDSSDAIDIKEVMAKLPTYLTDGIELPNPNSFRNKKKNPFVLTTPEAEAEGASPASQDSVMVFLTPGSQAQLGVTFTPVNEYVN